MDASRFLARRFRFQGRLAAVSVALSFLVMIVAVSVSSGFRQEIGRALASAAGDVRITRYDQDWMGEQGDLPAHPFWQAELEAIPGVVSVIPAVYRAGIVRNGDRIQGVMFKGVPGDSSVVIPSRLASLLGLREGDRMQCWFVGEKVRARNFTVRGIYPGVLDSDEGLVVYADMADLQRLNGWPEDRASALELRLDDRMRRTDRMREAGIQAGVIAMARQDDGPALVAGTAVDRFPQLFDWLHLIDFNVWVLLALMTLVAGFNMISGLLILLLRHIRTIGLLKSLGMTDRSIASVFLRLASVLVLKGMCVGNLLALGFCLLQDKTHLIRLDPSNYFVSFVPVAFNPGWILLADAVAYVMILALLLVPLVFISRVDPAQTVRSR